ncbi:uncharacterized protein LOC143297912 [Babylonia areolata]|uniref:uncharacterized protein LOC143297912 n=1 Tax=Babylonia areolata TaxID=304850 RepID=UPI003FD545C0
MGCSYSAAAGDGSEGACHTFRVYNVDSQGMELNPGKIQVAASDLILYQRGKEPIHWPLRCLRRYGFDAELFSFESGRRCPTGPGIYAFKCRHAEDLFNMVQESIQRAGQEDHLRATGGGGGAGPPHPHFPTASRPCSRPASGMDPPDQYGHMTASAPSTGRQPRIGGAPSAHHHLYINGGISMDPGHQYMNTRTGRGATGGAFQIDESAPLIHFMKRPGQHGGPGSRGQVNYAVLDLPSSTENLLDQDGQGALSNFPTPAGPPPNRLSLPTDLSGAQGPDDVVLQAGDSDVFLADPDGSATCPTYINVGVDQPAPSPPTPWAEAAGGSTSGGSSCAAGTVHRGVGGGLGVDRTAGSLPNYTNLPRCAGTGPRLGGRHTKPPGINYIQLDLNQAPSDSAGSSTTNMSPTSPTSMASVPESPGYAMIDFNKTEALSHSTRAGTDGEDEPGARKTRHNSTIGM